MVLSDVSRNTSCSNVTTGLEPSFDVTVKNPSGVSVDSPPERVIALTLTVAVADKSSTAG